MRTAVPSGSRLVCSGNELTDVALGDDHPSVANMYLPLLGGGPHSARHRTHVHRRRGAAHSESGRITQAAMTVFVIRTIGGVGRPFL